MESIDALAKAVNEYNGGLVLVSHDMRLISQVAEEIWICDHKTVKKYGGDIQNFKMDMRSQMGIAGELKTQLRGDASVRKQAEKDKPKAKVEKKEVLKKSVAPVQKKIMTPIEKPVQYSEVSKPKTSSSSDDAWGSDEEDSKKNESKPISSLTTLSSLKSSLPSAGNTSAPAGKYIPPHLRNKK